MRKLMLLALLAACGTQPANSQMETARDSTTATTSESREALLATIRAFDGAVASGDTAAAIAALHPDLMVFESGTVDVSKMQFVQEHLPADIEVMKNSTVTGEDPTIVVSEDGGLAVAMSKYRLVGSYKGRQLDSDGTKTVVLSRTSDGWKIRHIHYSSRPRT